jgi:hypothetical protein
MTVVAASVLHVILALQIPAPWIVPDELRYAELAKSLGDGALPRVRGVVTFEFGLGYPLLLAPIWALFDDVDVSYTAAKLLNSVVMGLTAIPAFFLARRFIDERGALVVAALSVGIPSLLFTGTIMTEVALYPTFASPFSEWCWRSSAKHSHAVGGVGRDHAALTVKMLALTLLIGYVWPCLSTTGSTPVEEDIWAIVSAHASHLAHVGCSRRSRHRLGGRLGRKPDIAAGACAFLQTSTYCAVPSWVLYTSRPSTSSSPSSRSRQRSWFLPPGFVETLTRALGFLP